MDFLVLSRAGRNGYSRSETIQEQLIEVTIHSSSEKWSSDRGFSPNFTANIKWIQGNQLTSIPMKYQKYHGLLMIYRGTEVN